MQIWDKGISVSDTVIDFTVGDDYILDIDLVYYDCIASKAHAKMLNKIDVISTSELNSLLSGLDEIIEKVKAGTFVIEKADEDCHAAIEKYLINCCGETGKKIHTGRSRNDQVLTALRLYEKDFIQKVKEEVIKLSSTIQTVADSFNDIPMPGYTHMRKAMPTSIGTWLKSFCVAFNEDILSLDHITDLIDLSPLGTAAGFGVPVFEIDQQFTSDELGFKHPITNPMYSQITRGKFEGNVINSCSQVMLTLNKLATDLITFSMTEFNFVTLPKEQCTGSSIMPQKINPDVLELVRAKYHSVIGDEFKVKSLIANLISGYNRDVQLTKGPMMNSIGSTLDSLTIMNNFIKEIGINKSACESAMTSELYATEKVNELVSKGESFRDAYKIVGKDIIKDL